VSSKQSRDPHKYNLKCENVACKRKCQTWKN